MNAQIPLFKVGMSSDLFAAHSYSANVPGLLAQTLVSGYIGQGPRVDEFEDALARYLPRRPLTTNSCTSALDLALHLVGVGPGDLVITTPQTCTATNSPIVTRGAIPLWADVTEQGLIDPESVADRFSRFPSAKAVVAVDWAGRLADYATLRKAAPGIPIIEDAAHRLPDGIVGGDYVAWSFQAIKFLTTGDGGALLVPPDQYERAKLLRWYGLDRESSADFRCSQDIQEVGYKYHMNDIAATIGLANLPLAKGHLRRHQLHAATLCGLLDVPFDPYCHYWFFPYTSERRDDLIAHLADEGIAASQVHARNDTHTGFYKAIGGADLPGVDWFDTHQLALPCGWWMTEDDVFRVADAVRRFQSS